MASPAQAAEPSFTVSGELGVVSDYRFRGMSLSDRKPALQGGMTVTHASGVYLGAWATTIADGDGGRDIETDFYAGFATDLGKGFAADLMITYYNYPSDESLNYFESYGTLTYTIGAATPRIGIAYAPAQSALTDELGARQRNLYISTGVDIAVPSTPVTLIAEIGREKGPFDGPGSSKWDWQIGARVEVGAASFGLAYVDTNLEPSDRTVASGVVASALLSF